MDIIKEIRFIKTNKGITYVFYDDKQVISDNNIGFGQLIKIYQDMASRYKVDKNTKIFKGECFYGEFEFPVTLDDAIRGKGIEWEEITKSSRIY